MGSFVDDEGSRRVYSFCSCSFCEETGRRISRRDKQTASGTRESSASLRRSTAAQAQAQRAGGGGGRDCGRRRAVRVCCPRHCCCCREESKHIKIGGAHRTPPPPALQLARATCPGAQATLSAALLTVRGAWRGSTARRRSAPHTHTDAAPRRPSITREQRLCRQSRPASHRCEFRG
jgi:hypothetical protein